MNLWRLEIARMVRTSRAVAIIAVYGFFAVLGPFSAAYINEILARFAGDGMQVTMADPVPLDGIVQFVSNASQLGLLAVVIVAAGALTFDARPELAAFLRTRVRRPVDLVWPRYAVVTTTAMLSLVVSTVIAVVTTQSLLGALPTGRVAVGTLYGAVYLAFAVAVVAAVAGIIRSQLMVVFISLVILLMLPLIGIIDAVRSWLPSSLLMSVAPIIAGEPASNYLTAVIMALATTTALLLFAVGRFARREH